MNTFFFAAVVRKGRLMVVVLCRTLSGDGGHNTFTLHVQSAFGESRSDHAVYGTDDAVLRPAGFKGSAPCSNPDPTGTDLGLDTG